MLLPAGLDTGLRERLRLQARAARDFAMTGEGSPSRYEPYGAALEPDPYADLYAAPATCGERVARDDDATQSGDNVRRSAFSGALGRVSGPDSAAEAGRGSEQAQRESYASSCPTCALLAEEYARHDAWVESLKASAEAVLATHQKVRIASIDHACLL